MGGRTGQGQSGQTVVLLALIMAVLMGCCALALDVARGMVTATHLQAAADSAALAGATALGQNDTLTPSQITIVVDNYLRQNNISLSDVKAINISDSPGSVQVELAQPMGFLLAPVIGFSSTNIFKASTATLYGPTPFNYALFSNEDLNLSQNKIDVEGDAHSNSNVNISANNGYINTTTEASDIINLSDIHFQTTLVEHAPVISMPDFSSEMYVQAEGYGQIYSGDYNINQNNCSISGTIYVNGNVNITTNNIKGNGSIFATGDININTNNASCGTGSIAYYSQHNINITTTNNLTGNGILYAPNGVINISANTIDIQDGAIIGDGINITSNTLEIDSSNLSSFNLPRNAYLSN